MEYPYLERLDHVKKELANEFTSYSNIKFKSFERQFIHGFTVMAKGKQWYSLYKPLISIYFRYGDDIKTGKKTLVKLTYKILRADIEQYEKKIVFILEQVGEDQPVEKEKEFM